MDKYCSWCNSKIFKDDRTCHQCGAPTKDYLRNIVKEVMNNNYVYEEPWPIALCIVGGDFELKRGNQKKLDVRCILNNGRVYTPNVDDLDFYWSNEIWIEKCVVKSNRLLFNNGPRKNIKITAYLKISPTIDSQVILTLI